MFRFVVLSCFLTSAIWFGSFTYAFMGNPKMAVSFITGGRPVNITDFPYQLSIQYYGIHRCGASIISTKWALTAAHCTEGWDASALGVRAGSSNWASGGQVIEVNAIYQHPRYNSTTMDYDLSILELASNLIYGPGVAAIPLAVNQSIPNSELAVVSGWGRLSENGTAPFVLQAVGVTIISNADCVLAYSKQDPPFTITDHMMCAGEIDGGEDACQGDSGGPLVVNNLLYGVVSTGHGCARAAFPGIYSRVSSLRSFVMKVTGLN